MYCIVMYLCCNHTRCSIFISRFDVLGCVSLEEISCIAGRRRFLKVGEFIAQPCSKYFRKKFVAHIMLNIVYRICNKVFSEAAVFLANPSLPIFLSVLWQVTVVQRAKCLTCKFHLRSTAALLRDICEAV